MIREPSAQFELLEGERFRPVPDTKYYRVSNKRRVYNMFTGRLTRVQKRASGREYVKIDTIHDGTREMTLDELVWTVFGA